MWLLLRRETPEGESTPTGIERFPIGGENGFQVRAKVGVSRFAEGIDQLRQPVPHRGIGKEQIEQGEALPILVC